jgi:NADH-quinone oxidoreductase subunit L
MKYSKNPELNEPAGAGKILANKWYIDELYDTIIVKPLLVFSTGLKNIVEKNIIDGTVNNVGKLVQYSARQIRLVQSGLVGNYIMIMVLAIVVFILMWFYDASIVKWVGKLFN